MNTKTALKFAKDLRASDIRAFARSVMEVYETSNDSDDFTAETEEGEYRFISKSSIEEIFAESVTQLADDCYNIERIKEKMGTVGRYFTFDYKTFIKDCRTDGYGYHFSGYDGSEYENDNYYMFRTN